MARQLGRRRSPEVPPELTLGRFPARLPRSKPLGMCQVLSSTQPLRSPLNAFLESCQKVRHFSGTLAVVPETPKSFTYKGCQ